MGELHLDAINRQLANATVALGEGTTFSLTRGIVLKDIDIESPSQDKPRRTGKNKTRYINPKESNSSS